MDVVSDEIAVSLVLADFQRHLRKSKVGLLVRLIQSRLPAEGIAERFAHVDDSGDFSGSRLGTWHITATSVDPVEPPVAVRSRGDRAEMRFALNDGAGVTTVTLGPRFGWGARFEIRQDRRGDYHVRTTETLWKS